MSPVRHTECALVGEAAIREHSAAWVLMSALTPKADIPRLTENFAFRIRPDVRFRVQSGRKSGGGQMSAYSQERT
jgi:hypothetical protein